MRLRMLVTEVSAHAVMIDGKPAARSRVSLVMSPTRYGYEGIVVDVPKDDERVTQLDEVESASFVLQMEEPDVKSGDEVYVDFSPAPGPSLKELADTQKAANEKAAAEAAKAAEAKAVEDAKRYPPLWIRHAEMFWSSEGHDRGAGAPILSRKDALAELSAKEEDLVGQLDEWAAPDNGPTFRMWNPVFKDSDNKHWRIIASNEPAKLRTALLKTPV